MRKLVPATLVLAGMLLAPSASAQGKTTITTETSLEASIKKGRFHGTLRVPGDLNAPGNLDPSTCLKDRQVEIFRKRAASDKHIGTAATDDTGNWTLRGKVAEGSYYIAIDEARFAYSPGYGYGETEEAICERMVGVFKVTSRSRVLGERFRSGDDVMGIRIRAGQLPFTGLPVLFWSLAAAGCLASGGSLVRMSTNRLGRKGQRTGSLASST